MSSIIALLFSAFVVINLNLLHSSIIEMANDAHVPNSALESISRSFLAMMGVTLVFAAASIIGGLVIGLTLTTRLFGPIVPMRRLIGQYIQGDYKARAELRKSDEFQELMKDINTLGATLEQRHSQKT